MKKNKKFEIWAWNGSYLKGTLRKTSKTLAAAKNFAKSYQGFARITQCGKDWIIMGTDNMAIGMICEVQEDAE